VTKNVHKILIVDDDERICRTVQRYLEKERYTVYSAYNAEQSREVLKNEQPDLVLLDLNLPGVHGFDLAREIRDSTNTGIIFITGSQEYVDKIVGLEIGADDFVTKPFDLRELLARIRSVLRRTSFPLKTQSTDKESNRFASFDGWKLDVLAQNLTSPTGEDIPLTSHEFKLLNTLIEAENRVQTRDQLMDKMSSREWNPIDRSIDVLIGKLRKKFSDIGTSPKYIKTIRSQGYKFTAKVEWS
jgi:DNA-binding response OmpR family regulator